MKKSIFAIIVIIVLLGGMYLLTKTPADTSESAGYNSDPQNTTYTINNVQVTLIDGSAEREVSPGSASKIVTKYFGNELRADLDDDGREDAVFLLTQNTGGSGTFYYVVAGLNTEDGWRGSHAVLLGDRIAPLTTELSQIPSHKNVIVVNYADRKPGEAMTEQLSVGKSIWLKFDPQSMQFGEVAQDFEGEANPDVMTLDMQPWTWIQTTYNNDTLLTPNDAKAFALSFKKDGMFSATTDCGPIFGAYKADGKKITFGDIATSRRFCNDSQLQEFTTMLGEIQSYFFTSRGELIFNLKFDSGSATFR